MIVGIDATCWSNPRGYGRYARGLLTALLAVPTRHEFVFFVDSATEAQMQWPFPKSVKTAVVKLQQSPTEAASANGQRSVYDLWTMTSAVSRVPLDVFFFPSVYTYFPVVSRARIIMGIHDVIVDNYPQMIFPDQRRRFLWQTKSWLARQQASYIVTVSDHAKQGILKHFGPRPERVWVVGEAADPEFRPIEDNQVLSTILARHGLLPTTRFVMCLGGLNPHKNLNSLLRAVAELRKEPQLGDLEVVLTGPAESDTFTPGVNDIRQVVAELKLEAVVHFTGYLPDCDVAALLNGAKLLVMPSFDEGFGLGAVEAAACGIPVVATLNSPLPQLLQGGGWFIDPHQPQQITHALRQALTDDVERRHRGQVALARAQSLTWPRAAQQFLALLDQIELN